MHGRALRKQVEGHDVAIKAHERDGNGESRATAAADLMKMAMSQSE